MELEEVIFAAFSSIGYAFAYIETWANTLCGETPMSLDIHPAIGTVLAELVSSSVIIAVGIYLECKKLDRLSIAFNVVGFLVMAFTTQLDVLVMPVLAFYLVIGVLIAVLKVEWLYGFFGSKTYGAFLLAIAIVHTPLVQPLYNFILSVHTVKGAWDVLIRFYTWLVVIWIVTAVCVWIVARIVKPKETPNGLSDRS